MRLNAQVAKKALQRYVSVVVKQLRLPLSYYNLLLLYDVTNPAKAGFL